MLTDIDTLIEQLGAAPPPTKQQAQAEPTGSLNDLYVMSGRVAELDKQIEGLERQLKDLKATRQSLAWSTMPNLQQELDVPDITIKGRRIRIEEIVKASSSQKDWDKAFALLSKHGETEAVKWTATLTLPKLSTEEQHKLIAKLEKAAGIPVALGGYIHHANLKKWLGDLEQQGKLTDDLRSEFKYEKNVITTIEDAEVKNTFTEDSIDGI